MIYIAVVTLYVLMLLGISVYKSRTVKSDEDFMVAGRSVPVYMLVATLVCTWVGSGSLFGFQVVPDALYDFGYVDNGLMVLAPGAFIIIGLFVWLEHTLLNRRR